MKTYVVRSGDYLERVAQNLGLSPRTLWDHPDNAELAASRDPNLLLAGDILVVPSADPLELPLEQGTDNVYIADVPATTVTLTFKDGSGPFSDEPFVVDGLGRPFEGATDGAGTVTLHVPVHLREVRVTFPKRNVTYPIAIGEMDPIDEPSGVRKRLSHLGYLPHTSDDALSDYSDEEAKASVEAALRGFQKKQGLTPTGELDDETKSALKQAHGS